MTLITATYRFLRMGKSSVQFKFTESPKKAVRWNFTVSRVNR